mgnify:FL=1
MRGFSNSFADPPDYILKITEQIWEGRDLRSLDHYYAPDLPMRFPSGLVRGNQAVIDGTLATLAEFPDRQLLGEDVIWSDDGDGGFLSSHRLVTCGTRVGRRPGGRATGERVEIRAIADCAAKENAIYDEWLVRDVGGIARQLGWAPADYARHLIEREGGPDHATRPFTPADDVDGGYASRGNDNEWGQRLADILTRIMDKDLTVIRAEYDRAVRTEHPGAQGGWSWDFAERQWMALRTAFPSAKFDIHHVIGREDSTMPPRAAVRWSLDGTHDGFGAFGQPTGAPVHIMGITHADFGTLGAAAPKLRREFTLWDEISIWKQIHLHTGLAQ